MIDNYRNLTKDEIEQLVKADCVCSDWSRIKVIDGFNPNNIKDVSFGGDVRLGSFIKPISFVAGFNAQCGIYHSTIHNCRIGNNVYINNVHTLANYIIEDDCIIANISYLAVQGCSSFGNGTEAAVINEGGGREVKIYDKLSAQTAYIMALYRHRDKMIKHLDQLIENYINSISSCLGIIGKGTKIMNCGTLKNIKVGRQAILEGVNRLENGSINSTESANVRIGANVIAKDFIISSGARILDNVILDKVFVGQGTELGKGYSAENSVFFANCGGFHGEACSVFAGPFTVTHHKATLLIAGMFSFFNAGSSSNQSNHMYKLGSVHQAIFERGCKMGSGAYVLYPARLGAFNVILGKHASHPDTRNLPFSYILQSDMKTLIIPGLNLRSSGTLRDMTKWSKRDKRTDQIKLDKVCFDSFSPYTAEKMFKAIEILNTLANQKPDSQGYVKYQDCLIKESWIQKGIEYYVLALRSYLGGKVAKYISAGIDFKGVIEDGLDDWVDAAGLLCPKKYIEQICDDIQNGLIDNIQDLAQRFETVHKNYQMYEQNWITRKFIDSDIPTILKDWKAAFEKMAEYIIEDAQKEFNATAMIPYGIDDDEKTAKQDFDAVRGSLQTNEFIIKLKEQVQEKQKLYEKVMGNRQ